MATKSDARRRRIPSIVRRNVEVLIDAPVNEEWTIGYRVGTIYLRDLWMHRVDAARATGRPIVLAREHDGRIIADIVAEWTRRHGRPLAFELTGPLGGLYIRGPQTEDCEQHTLETVEFCRTLGGLALHIVL